MRRTAVCSNKRAGTVKLKLSHGLRICSDEFTSKIKFNIPHSPSMLNFLFTAEEDGLAITTPKVWEHTGNDKHLDTVPGTVKVKYTEGFHEA